MSAFLHNTLGISVRHLRELARQPVYLAFNLIQPIIWLLLFGQLFKSVVEIPGFDADSYITYLVPGVVVMLALYSNGWAGMSFIEDIERGVLDRFLVSPISRGALIAGSIVYQAIVTLIQVVIVLILGWLLGADYGDGPGLLALVLAALLLGAAFAAFSNALALVLRSQESVIGAVSFIVLPLTFVSGAFMPLNLTPNWIQQVARFNPVNWAVQLSREAVSVDPDAAAIALRGGLLLALALLCAWGSTRAFRGYQQSI